MELPEEMKPVRVCLYWRDVQLKRHLKYLDAGFECFTAGHMFDHDFHFRLLKIIARHQNCITNSMGTSTLLAVSFGLKAHLIEQDLGVQGTSHFLTEYAPKITQPSALNLLESMRIPPDQSRSNQKVWGDMATGREFVQTPEQLHALIMDHSGSRTGTPCQKQSPRSWDQEIRRLNLAGSSDLKTEGYVIVPEGNAFHCYNPFRLVENHETWQREGAFPNLSGTGQPVILDCGCDTGYTSIRLAQTWPNAQVYGFEANPLKVKSLFRNLDSTGMSNVAVSQKAVWTESGRVSFETSAPDSQPQINRVRSIRLKDLLREGKVDLLRLNIANATLPVIQDCGADLVNVRHLVVIISNEENQRTDFILLLAELSAMGFHIQIKNVKLLDDSKSELRMWVTGHRQE